MTEKILGMAKVFGVDHKTFRITLVQEVAKALEISKGDRIIFCKDETGRIYIRKA